MNCTLFICVWFRLSATDRVAALVLSFVGHHLLSGFCAVAVVLLKDVVIEIYRREGLAAFATLHCRRRIDDSLVALQEGQLADGDLNKQLGETVAPDEGFTAHLTWCLQRHVV